MVDFKSRIKNMHLIGVPDVRRGVSKNKINLCGTKWRNKQSPSGHRVI